MTLTQEIVQKALEGVKDPEIPVLSVVHLGIVRDVHVEDNVVSLVLTPTFAGCPAIEMMKNDIERTCLDLGATSVQVTVMNRAEWTTNQITKEGIAALKSFGISPPPQTQDGEVELEDLLHAQCPQCNSTDTVLKNAFGPTACRAIYFCHSCHETFEQMKPL